MVAEILMMTEDFRNSPNRKIITFLLLSLLYFLLFFPDCMIGTYGVLKLPVISNFLPSPIVTVLMTMLVEKLVSWIIILQLFFPVKWQGFQFLQLAVLMRTVPSLVSMERYNEDSRNNYFSNKCNNKSLALNRVEPMYEMSTVPNLWAVIIHDEFFYILCFKNKPILLVFLVSFSRYRVNATIVVLIWSNTLSMHF